MDSDGLPIVGSGVDYSKVDPLNQKRTLTFLNHFLIRTTSFLNNFSSVCDEKLENLLNRIQRLESSMCILEAKLASIPGLEDIEASTQASAPVGNAQTDANAPSEAPASQANSETPATNVPASSVPETQQEQQIPKKTVSQDPRFAKYFKMISMGVPPGAVQIKMTAEGVDPSILNDPDAEAPPGAPEPVSDEDSDQSAGSDFSD